jgi:hypothetical protein
MELAVSERRQQGTRLNEAEFVERYAEAIEGMARTARAR